MDKNEIATVNGNSLINSNMSFEDRKKAFNMVVNTELKLSDFINKEIDVKGFYIIPCEMNNSETGQTIVTERLIVVDKDDKSYHSVAKGLVSSFKSIEAIFGAPNTWNGETLKIRVVQKKVDKGQTYVAELV